MRLAHESHVVKAGAVLAWQDSSDTQPRTHLEVTVVKVVEIGAAVLCRAGPVATIEAVVTASWRKAGVLSVEEQVERVANDEHVRHNDAEVHCGSPSTWTCQYEHAHTAEQRVESCEQTGQGRAPREPSRGRSDSTHVDAPRDAWTCRSRVLCARTACLSAGGNICDTTDRSLRAHARGLTG
jgi:hypothetical protein